MKRIVESAFGVGLLAVLASAPAVGQAIRVDIGIRTPHVGARVVYGPGPRPAHWRHNDWVFVARLNRYELALYREFLVRHPRYRFDARAHHRRWGRDRAAWEREFRREQRDAEREFRKWMKEHQRDRDRARRRGRGR